MRGPAEKYVRDYTLRRQHSDGWTLMEQALVMTLIDWKCDAEMRPNTADCSDLMNTALARILGLASGELLPQDVLDAIEPPDEGGDDV